MKHSLLLIAVILFAGIGIKAQNLQLSTMENEVLSSNQVVYTGGTINNEAVVEVKVKNIGTSAIRVKAKKILISVPENSMNVFCLSLCYPPMVTVSPDSVVINPGESFIGFSGHYTPFDRTEGIIGYTFFNMDNPNDSISFISHYVPSYLYAKYDGKILQGGSVLHVNASLDAEAQIEFPIFNSDKDNAKDVLAKKTELQTVEGTINLFCWTECYSPNVFLSTGPVSINPEDSVNNFSGHYTANNKEGATTVRYTFFDRRTTSDSTWIDVVYRTNVGINEQPSLISSIYPNPASNLINFNLTDQVKQGAEVIIYNLNGQVVYRELIANNKHNQINIAHLSQGFYQLVVNNNGQLSSPKKLAIVK